VRLDRFHRILAQLRQRSAQIEQSVGSQDPDAAIIGDDGQPLAGFGNPLQARQSTGGIEQPVQIVDPQQPGAADHRVIHGVFGGQNA
jgi:hypothetical protein